MITHQAEYHYHDYYEISVILSCKNVVYVAEGMEYKLSPGDILLCNVFEPHHYRETGADAYCERFNVGVDSSRMFQYSSRAVGILSVFQKEENGEYPLMRFGFEKVYKYYQIVDLYENIRHYHNEMMETGLVYILLAYLSEDICVTREYDTLKIKNIRLVAHLIEYINRHAGENLTLSQLSKETNYSVSHICAVFKKVTNKTINSYIKEKRMEQAVQYLRENMSLSEVAERAGFHNYSYFYKAFKKIYGISPMEYRDNLKNKE